jgi:Zn/Cd-binding protein ZinT
MINGTAWLLQYTEWVRVIFPDNEVVQFSRVDDNGNWQVIYDHVADINQDRVIEFIDGYMEQDELAINFLNKHHEVIWQVKPYRGAELV